MKNKLFTLFVASLLVVSCDNPVKNENPKVEEEEGVKITKDSVAKINIAPEEENEPYEFTEESMLGFWVGYFYPENEHDYEHMISADEFSWFRQNKINISIDSLANGRVIGHSVVGGNNRPFVGEYQLEKNGRYSFEVKEPGDHGQDGAFSFSVFENALDGTWMAYKDVEIRKRKYNLEKRVYNYNPEIMLDSRSRFIDWNKSRESEPDTMEYDGELEIWVNEEYASATNAIYEINASTTDLTEGDVENLKKSDLRIIRNTIYARHGYSFKNRPLRVFFDSQSWYIPVYSDITKELSQTELDNIQLLLRYEKNAEEYYDYFGRG